MEENKDDEATEYPEAKENGRSFNRSLDSAVERAERRSSGHLLGRSNVHDQID